MTSKEALAILQNMEYDLSNQLGSKYCQKKYEAIGVAIKLLKREAIIDKIKTEIGQGYCVVNNDYDQGRNYGLYMATQIIDKYKIESEER